MMFRVLGLLAAEVGGAPVHLASARQRAILAVLLLSPNDVVSTDRMVDAVWGEELPEHPANAVQNLIARLRRALDDDGTLIVTKPGGYVLAVDPTQIDAHRFERGYREARALLAHDPQRAVALLDAALAHWHGPAYSEHAAGFARAEATRLEELRLAAQEDRIVAALSAGAVNDAIARAQALTSEHPLRERPVELLMRALATGGRVGDALTAFQDHRKIVDVELGLEPSDTLRGLEAQILRGELQPTAMQAAPPAAAAPRPRPLRHLPWRPSGLLGRDSELHDLLAATRRHRLVTLVGPGGVGKTRLCLEAAHALADDGEAVWWIDLVPAGAERVVDAVAGVIGIEVTDDDDPTGALCAALAALRGVVCLDNAEHVLEPVALLLERLFAETPALRVITTSRERLAVDEEAVFAVSPLPLPIGADRHNPAVRLFVDRWMRGRDTPVTDDDIRLVAEICRRLDGLPLAIELGAGQAASLGLGDVARRLGDRFDLLVGGRRTALPRHRTLRAVVDWSHDLLSDQESVLFARLAVFPRSFSLDQAEAVCADEQLERPNVAALVSRLVEQSLVQRVQGRYRLLESLRHYALARLAANGEEPELRRRHAEDTATRLSALRRDLWGSGEAAASAALAALVDDLHAAWSHAVAHDRDLAVRLAADVYDFAYYGQRRDLMDWGLQVASWEVDHPRLPAALATAATAALTRGQLDDAWRLATRGVAAAGGEDDPAAAPALDVLADLTMFQGRIGDAVERYLQAASLHARRGHGVEALISRIAARQAMTYGGRWAEADQDLTELLDEARAAANPSAISFAYFAMGEAAVHTDVDRARRCYARVIDDVAPAGARLFTMLARAALMVIVASHDPRDSALAAFEDVLDQCEQIGSEALLWWTLLSAVVLLERFDGAEDAAVLAGAVLAAHERRPTFAPDTERLEAALARLRSSIGVEAVAAGLAEGASFTVGAAVSHARRAITSLSRQTEPPAVQIPT
jgi:predicted ATPase/DNA-binding SARP family transcriptional activator